MTAKTLNPFIPAVSLIVVPKDHHRTRFKNTFYTVLGVHAVVLMGLLLHALRGGSVTAMAETETYGSPAVVSEKAPAAAEAAASVPAPVVAAPVAAVATTQPATATIDLPAQPPAAPPTTQATPEMEFGMHVVKSGDTLGQIAKSYGTTVKALRSANGLSTDRLMVGTRLKVPRRMS